MFLSERGLPQNFIIVRTFFLANLYIRLVPRLPPFSLHIQGHGLMGTPGYILLKLSTKLTEIWEWLYMTLKKN